MTKPAPLCWPRARSAAVETFSSELLCCVVDIYSKKWREKDRERQRDRMGVGGISVQPQKSPQQMHLKQPTGAAHVSAPYPYSVRDDRSHRHFISLHRALCHICLFIFSLFFSHTQAHGYRFSCRENSTVSGAWRVPEEFPERPSYSCGEMFDCISFSSSFR